MQRVQSFRPNHREILEAVTGGLGSRLTGLLVCGAALALLWRVRLVTIDRNDDPFELTLGGIGALILIFGAGCLAADLIATVVGRRPRGTARLVLTDTARLGGHVRGELRLSWPMRQVESAVAVLEARSRAEGPMAGPASRYRSGGPSVWSLAIEHGQTVCSKNGAFAREGRARRRAALRA
jgi:hypothetical protein